MTSYLLAGPAAEPVTLAEAKAFVRVDDTVEDAFITTLITAARLHVEGTTGRAMIAQTWRVSLDCWPENREVHLPVGPLISLTSMTVYDDDGIGANLSLVQFQPETNTQEARIFLPATIAGVPAMRQRRAIEIDYVAGYGTDPQDVPTDLRQAVLTLIGYWFEHRDAVVIAGSGAVVPGGFDRMISAYRTLRL